MQNKKYDITLPECRAAVLVVEDLTTRHRRWFAAYGAFPYFASAFPNYAPAFPCSAALWRLTTIPVQDYNYI